MNLTLSVSNHFNVRGLRGLNTEEIDWKIVWALQTFATNSFLGQLSLEDDKMKKIIF